MSPSCYGIAQVVGDDRASSNLPSGPLLMVVVWGRYPLRNYMLVCLVGLVGLEELDELDELVASVAGQRESKTPGTIAEAGGSRWVSGCSPECCCMCMMVRTVWVVEECRCLAGVQGR
jgi:hypothetical protein